MSKRTTYTIITPLSPQLTRELVLSQLHDHNEMIELNPLVVEHHPIKPPKNAPAEEYHCVWHSLTDKVQYLPGGFLSGNVSYNVCFHDLPYGLQTHCYAPLGLDIKGRWTLGGNLPGEPREVQELGLKVPPDTLYLREDVDMRCNIVMTGFVKKTLNRAHGVMVARMLARADLLEDAQYRQRTSVATSESGQGSLVAKSVWPMPPCSSGSRPSSSWSDPPRYPGTETPGADGHKAFRPDPSSKTAAAGGAAHQPAKDPRRASARPDQTRHHSQRSHHHHHREPVKYNPYLKEIDDRPALAELASSDARPPPTKAM